MTKKHRLSVKSRSKGKSRLKSKSSFKIIYATLKNRTHKSPLPLYPVVKNKNRKGKIVGFAKSVKKTNGNRRQQKQSVSSLGLYSEQDVLKMEYPYYRYMYTFNLNEYMQNFHSYHAVIETSNRQNIPNLEECQLPFRMEGKSGNYVIIMTNYMDKLEWFLNKLTDYFSEHVRVRCVFKGSISPLEYWQKNKEIIVRRYKSVYDVNDQMMSLYDIQELMYGKVRWCNNFRITVASAVLQLFRPKTWLDISAGWGDRLISAIINGVEKYEAADPNLDLHPCYRNIVLSLTGCDGNKVSAVKKKRMLSKYKVHATGFLEAEFEGRDFDLVFSSPPFFDLEIYSGFQNDSMVKYGETMVKWVDEFLMKSIEKAYGLLKVGGYMILYVGEHGEYGSRRMQEWNGKMRKLGIMYFYENRARGMHVWQKV